MADVITRFKLETTQYDSKLREASKSLAEYTRQATKAGSEFKDFTQKNVEAARALGTITPSANNAKEKVKELVGAFNDAAKAYNALTKEQQQSDFGKALGESLNQLKGRIRDAKIELNDINKELGQRGGAKFGQFSSVIDTVGNKLGIAGSLTDMLTSRTALMTAGIGAATTAVIAATKAWADYNSELARNDNATMVTTGLKGPDMTKMTDAMMSVSKVYGVDFRQAINAANTLMVQFGLTGDESIQLIRDGMQGMIQGDGPKLLSMIQQYAPSFRDAGISAQQLVAIIHNSEGGIFTDQNMNAIVMGIKNIRLMTKNTSDALAQLGIDGEEMTKKLNDGTMTIFEAMKQVMQALQGVESGSRTAGEVMQAVFGRQGAAAGTNLAKAIETLNLNLDETKRQTGDVGDSIAQLERATGELNEAFRDCFGWDGWQQMATGIKTEFVEGLTTILNIVAQIRKHVKWTLQNLNIIERETPQYEPRRWDDFELDSNVVEDARRKREEARERIRNRRNTTHTNTSTKGSRGSTGTNPVEGSVDWQAKKVQDLQKAWRAAANDDSRRKIKAELDAQQKILEKMEGKQKSVLTQSTSRTELQILQDQLRTVKEFQGAYGKATEEWREAQNEINDLTKQIIALNDNTLNLFNKPATITADSVKSATTISKEDLEGLQLSYDRATSTTSIDEYIETSQKLVSGLSQVASGLQQMGIKLPEGVQKIIGFGQGLLSVIQGVKAVYDIFNTITSTTQIAAETANTTAIVGLTTAIIGNTAALYANATLEAIPFFKTGGIVHAAAGYRVPGNDFSDHTPVMVSSGELILNRAQQGNIASQLEESRQNNTTNIVGRIAGEDIILSANNYLRRTGKGELVTWKS